LPFCLAKLLTIASSSSGSRYSVFGPSGISCLGLWRLTLAELQGSPPLPHFSSPARMALQLYKSGGSAVAGTPQAQIQRPATCRIQRCNGKPSAPSYFCNRRGSLVGISPGRITEMSLCLTRRLDCYDVESCPRRKETLSDRDCRYCNDRGEYQRSSQAISTHG
jgi:hypothetical protein